MYLSEAELRRFICEELVRIITEGTEDENLEPLLDVNSMSLPVRRMGEKLAKALDWSSAEWFFSDMLSAKDALTAERLGLLKFMWKLRTDDKSASCDIKNGVCDPENLEFGVGTAGPDVVQGAANTRHHQAIQNDSGIAVSLMSWQAWKDMTSQNKREIHPTDDTNNVTRSGYGYLYGPNAEAAARPTRRGLRVIAAIVAEAEGPDAPDLATIRDPTYVQQYDGPD
jgi:hypothetical protein